MGTDTGNPNIVAGTVRDSANAPMSACTLWIYKQTTLPQVSALAKTSLRADTNKTLQLVVTDQDGRFEITGLPAGDYTLTAISRQKGQGIQNTLHVGKQDTITDALPDVMAPLLSALPAIPVAWLGDSLTIRETGWRLEIGKDFHLPTLAAGLYTLQADQHPDSLLQLAVPPYPVGEKQVIEWLADGTGQLKLPDGSVYKLIRIRQQIWFAENSRQVVPGSVCHPSEPLLNCATYGRWYTHAQAQSACPDGWRLPDSVHWSDLEKQDNGLNAGVHLKATHSWHSDGGLDLSGFSALPAGTTEQPTIGYHAYFWTAASDKPTAYHLSDTSDLSAFEDLDEEIGVNVRCVADM